MKKHRSTHARLFDLNNPHWYLHVPESVDGLMVTRSYSRQTSKPQLGMVTSPTVTSINAAPSNTNSRVNEHVGADGLVVGSQGGLAAWWTP
jgi:hypothetical protein